MKITDLHNLLFNPIWIGKLLHYFLSGACSTKQNKIKFELIYFLLPFVYDKKIFYELQSKNKSSYFSSLFQKNYTKNQLCRKNEQAKNYKDITNNALLYLSNQIDIKVNEYIEIKELVDYRQSKEETKDYYKAAHNLGLIFAKEDYKNIFLRIQ